MKAKVSLLLMVLLIVLTFVMFNGVDAYPLCSAFYPEPSCLVISTANNPYPVDWYIQPTNTEVLKDQDIQEYALPTLSVDYPYPPPIVEYPYPAPEISTPTMLPTRTLVPTATLTPLPTRTLIP